MYSYSKKGVTKIIISAYFCYHFTDTYNLTYLRRCCSINRGNARYFQGQLQIRWLQEEIELCCPRFLDHSASTCSPAQTYFANLLAKKEQWLVRRLRLDVRYHPCSQRLSLAFKSNTYTIRVKFAIRQNLVGFFDQV